MARSIFDPEGGETEHSGSTFTGPAADNDSQMPVDVVDGKVSDAEVDEQDVTRDPDVLRNLEELEKNA